MVGSSILVAKVPVATATIAEFLDHFMDCIDVCLEKRRGDSGVKQVLLIFLEEATR